MSFEIQILGSNSAVPAYNRNHTSQLVQIEGNYFLFDCGEGTQIQLIKYKCKFSKINHIFISHLHGDHYLGLMGLLSTFYLSGRKNTLHIYAPSGLKEIITTQLKYGEVILSYTIEFHELFHEKKIILDLPNLTITTIPLIHRLPCNGFVIREKPKKRRINKYKIPENFPVQYFDRLVNGEDIIDEQGNILYKNKDLTLPPNHSRSYAYCTDTRYFEDLAKEIKGVDLLYHESTFLDEENEWAAKTFHSTARQAGKIAQLGKVKKLMLGHYSARYKNLNLFVEEAKSEFIETIAAVEGETITLEE